MSLVRKMQGRGLKQFAVAYSLSSILSAFAKVFGFLREALIAGMFGVGPVSNGYYSLLAIHNCAASFFSGAFLLWVVPVVRQNQGPGTGASVTLKLLRRSVYVVGALAVVFGVLSYTIPSFMGLAGMLMPGTITLMYISVVMLPIGSALTGYFLANNKTTAAAKMGTLASFGATLVIVVAYYLHIRSQWLLAAATLASTLPPAVFAVKFLRAERRDQEPTAIECSNLYLALLENVVFTLTTLGQLRIYSELSPGSFALYNYGLRLVAFPSLLLIGPLQQLAFRRFGKEGVSRTSVLPVVGSSIAVSCVLVLLFLFFGEFLVKAVYFRGAMTKMDVVNVGVLLVPLALSTYAVALSHTMARLMFSLNKGRVYVGVMLVNYLLAYGVRLTFCKSMTMAGLLIAGSAVEVVSAAVIITMCLQYSRSHEKRI